MFDGLLFTERHLFYRTEHATSHQFFRPLAKRFYQMSHNTATHKRWLHYPCSCWAVSKSPTSTHDSEASNLFFLLPLHLSCIPINSKSELRSFPLFATFTATQMADASDSAGSERGMMKRQAPKDAAEQQLKDETRQKRVRRADPQQSSNHSFLLPPSNFPENDTVDLTGSEDEDQDMFMDWDHEESPMRDSNEVVAPTASGPYDACFGLVRRPP